MFVCQQDKFVFRPYFSWLVSIENSRRKSTPQYQRCGILRFDFKWSWTRDNIAAPTGQTRFANSNMALWLLYLDFDTLKFFEFLRVTKALTPCSVVAKLKNCHLCTYPALLNNIFCMYLTCFSGNKKWTCDVAGKSGCVWCFLKRCHYVFIDQFEKLKKFPEIGKGVASLARNLLDICV